MNYNASQPNYDPSKGDPTKDDDPSDDTINNRIDVLKKCLIIYGSIMLSLSVVNFFLMRAYKNVKGISAKEVEAQKLLKRRTGSYAQMASGDP